MIGFESRVGFATPPRILLILLRLSLYIHNHPTTGWLNDQKTKIKMGSSSLAVGSGLHNVFVYGSLLADDVVRVLLNRVPPSSTAILNNHHRFSIKERVYPAILPVENKKVTGRVLLGISGTELDILDTFEDVEYERTTVDVYLVDRSESLQAHAYVWGNKDDPNLYGEWNFEEWKKAHMNDFIKMTAEFKQELELPDSKPRVTTYESFYNGTNFPTT